MHLTFSFTLPLTLSLILSLTLSFASASSHPGIQFDRILIIPLENTDYDSALRDPYLSSLATRGLLFTNYLATTHPSQPNYLVMASGTTGNVTDDDPHMVYERNIVDILEEYGVSWRAYMENYPGGCSNVTQTPDGLYQRKHNPFISFHSVIDNPERCARIVNATEFERDVENNCMPEYAFYTPNMHNDGHDSNVSVASAWLERFLEPKFRDPKFMQGRMLVVVTFDEREDYDGEENKVWTVMVGSAVRKHGKKVHQRWGHEGLIELVVKNWRLRGVLGKEEGERVGRVYLG